MALIENPNRLLDGHREPWNCDACGKLIYSTDLEGRPAPGAPLPHYVSNEFKNVCSLCHGLYNNARFDSNYWRELHREWTEQQAKLKKKLDGLSGRTDYFTGV